MAIGTSLLTIPMWIYVRSFSTWATLSSHTDVFATMTTQGKRVRSLIARKLHIERANAALVDS